MVVEAFEKILELEIAKCFPKVQFAKLRKREKEWDSDRLKTNHLMRNSEKNWELTA